jgi:hypothetical protein
MKDRDEDRERYLVYSSILLTIMQWSKVIPLYRPTIPTDLAYLNDHIIKHFPWPRI